ncbi:hypothetical protein PSECIP111854_02588 [Pseudoalteromonas sp. CIP111854]|uniref:Uncharacterized protein n=2 Tax=Pseudoalteromonas holothuriae TaxID=2963714 RepID=A0A9W4R042_9GAMM|nr:hypothetical protein PSECIP111854_02588 [Pseudoalteromonas sp. CIP111854]
MSEFKVGLIIMNLLKMSVVFLFGFAAAFMLGDNVQQIRSVESVVSIDDNKTVALHAQIAQLTEENNQLREQVAILELPIEAAQATSFSVPSGASSQQSTEQITPKPALSAQVKKSMQVFEVKPVVFALSSELKLQGEQNNVLEQLLTKKAQADFESWQALSERLEQQPDNHEYYRQLYNEEIIQNSAEYRQSIASTLTAEQLEQYQVYERGQAQLTVSQKQSILAHSVSQLNLSAFQQQEIERLSEQVYSVSQEIDLGSTGSPYANPSVSTDFEKLSQIKALFTQEQLNKLRL